MAQLSEKFRGLYTYCIGKKVKKNILPRHVIDISFNLLGHSLGAQICGMFGKTFSTGLKGIVALDPAGPIFEENDSAHKITKTDANFVQAFHTNTKCLGHSGGVGLVDYYVNGGEWQPSCGKTDGGCSHSFSHQLLIKIYNKMDSTPCSDFGNFFPKMARSGPLNLDSNSKFGIALIFISFKFYFSTYSTMSNQLQCVEISIYKDMIIARIGCEFIRTFFLI